MKTGLRPAFYAVPGGALQDCLTLLHPPYTVWHLSYVVLGAAAAPEVYPSRVGGTLLAFFLAVGLGAHALDELNGRPLRTHVRQGALIAVAVCSIAGALGIGALAAVLISPWAVPLVIFGGFTVVAYNLEWWSGRMHSDIWFGLAWGAFPAIAGYWANAQCITPEAIAIAGACFALSLAQRVLSKQVRGIRRSSRHVTGRIEYEDGQVTEITSTYLLAAPEAALRLLTVSVAVLAFGLLLARL